MTGAVTMAFLTVGVVGVAALLALLQVGLGQAGIQSWLFLVTVPGLIGLARGAVLLHHGRPAVLLVRSGLFTAAALSVTALAGLVAYAGSASAAAPLFLVPLPAIAAALSRRVLSRRQS